MRHLSLLIPVLLSVGSAFASRIDYTLVGSTDSVAFSLSQTPTPLSCAYAANCFSVSAPDLTIDHSSVANAKVSFYQSSEGGGITILSGSTLLINNNGPNNLALFTGSLASPTLETFSNLVLLSETYGSPFYTEAFTLNATTASSAVPEPASLPLLAGGLIAVAVLAARRRRLATGLPPRACN